MPKSLFEVKIASYPALQQQLDMQSWSPEPASVLLGNNPGRIYANNLISPSVILIWSRGIEGFYLDGDPSVLLASSSLPEFIDRTITPVLLEAGCDFLEISAIGALSDAAIPIIFSDRKLTSWRQWTHDFKRKQAFRPQALPAGYTLHNYKGDPAGQPRTENASWLSERIDLHWSDPDRLLAMGSCYYATHEQTIIGVCMTGFAGIKEQAIYVEVASEHRRQNIAYALTTHVIFDIMKREKTPYWECEGSNVASRNLAAKLGFCKTGEYVCFGFPLPA